MINNLKRNIENIWTYDDKSSFKEVVNNVIKLVDEGVLRVAEKSSYNEWITNDWIKKAIIIFFQLNENFLIGNPPNAFDKIPLKFNNWNETDFHLKQIRLVPGSIIRYGAYIEKKCVIMPSFINIGAYIDEGTMIDTWATVGSCAQIGKNCHISGCVGIGGVLEPVQDTPVIIEDNCFIGARSEIVEGVRIGEGCVLSMGNFIGKSTRIIDKKSGEIIYGYVPPYSVVVPGSFKISENLNINCSIIVKKVDEKTRSKVKINELLRISNAEQFD